MRKFVTVTLVSLVTLAIMTPSSSAYVSSSARPIFFLHGYEAWNCPSSDGNSTWGAMISFLQARGFTGSMRKDAYYSCDTNMNDSLDGYGSHTAYNGTTDGHETGTTGHLSHNRYASIRHLAYHAAWQIYSEYSSKGVTVEVVTHSMGGLIARWMLYRIQAHDSSFPPYLYVSDVMAFAPPNDGSGYASWCWTTQCGEMSTGSSFLNELNTYATNPQGTNGTDWTVMGSNCDSTVSGSSATNMGSVHKVIYYGPCYGHSDYMQDTSTATDGNVDYADPPSNTWYSWYSAPHALKWATNALLYNTW